MLAAVGDALPPAVATVCLRLNRSCKRRLWPLLQTGSLLLHPRLGLLEGWIGRERRRGKVHAEVVAALARPFSRCAGAVTVLTFGPPVLRLGCPAVLRTLTFYEHILPIFAGYMRTLCFETRGLDEAAAQAVWDARHEKGSDAIVALMKELSGFYLKIGQVFATKQDLFPPQYIKKLRYLFDETSAAPFAEVKEIVEAELGRDLGDMFRSFDPQPLASATIAQVHRATTLGGQECAVKVQHRGMERLMVEDMGNMLFFARFMKYMKFDLKVDQVSILQEYREQVPLEFDFEREAESLTRIDKAIHRDRGCPHVVLPGLKDRLCSRRVLTMHFLDGQSLNAIIKDVERQMEQRTSIDGDPRKGLDVDGAAAAAPVGLDFDPALLLERLLHAYGRQIFAEGLFHSDPHPGNILVLPGSTVGLIDFGEVKEVDAPTRVAFAKLTIALAWRNQEVALPLLDATGTRIDNVSDALRMAVAYVMYDTRMDIPEAHMSPLDMDVPDEIKDAAINVFPQEYFMFLRVTALVRGLLAAFGADLSASQIWEPYAQAYLKKIGVEAPLPPMPEAEKAQQRKVAAGTNAAPGRASGSVYARMRRLAEWLRARELPHDRRALTPMAIAGLTTLREIAEADTAQLESGLVKFSPDKREKLLKLAKEAAAVEREAEPVPEARPRRASDSGLSKRATTGTGRPKPKKLRPKKLLRKLSKRITWT